MSFVILHGALSWLLLATLMTIIAPVILTLFVAQSFVMGVSKISKFRDLGIENQIASLDHLFFADDYYIKPIGANIFVYVLEGPINSKNLRLKVSQILSNNKGYDRLISLRPTTFLGFPYWIKTGSKGTSKSSFSVENHFIENNIRINGNTELNNYLVKHLQSPFHQDRPLWDILYLNNFFPDNMKGEPHAQRSVYAFRSHHLVGDGKSMINIFEAITGNSDPHVKSKSRNDIVFSKNLIAKINYTLKKCQDLFWVPYMVLNNINDFCFHKNFTTDPKKANVEMHLVRTEIPMSKFSAIRKQFFEAEPLGSLAVQNLIATGALRKHYQREFGVDNNQLGSARVFASLLWNEPTTPENIGQFKNQFTVGIFKMPLNEPSRKIRRDKILEDVQIAARCRFPSAYMACLPIYRLFPSAFLEAITAFNLGCPALLSNNAGPKNPVYVDGKRVLNSFGIAGLNRPHGGMTHLLLSYDGIMSATFLFNKELIPSGDTCSLAKDYNAEVDLILANKK